MTLEQLIYEGQQKGRFEEKLAVAERSLAAGAKPSFIAEITGLPLEKIKAIEEATEH